MVANEPSGANTEPTTLCPACQGSKTFVGFVDGVKDGKRFGRSGTFACDVCKGQGVVTGPQAAQIIEGRHLRDDRRERGLSLGQEARLGITPQALNNIEFGRSPAPETESVKSPVSDIHPCGPPSPVSVTLYRENAKCYVFAGETGLLTAPNLDELKRMVSVQNLRPALGYFSGYFLVERNRDLSVLVTHIHESGKATALPITETNRAGMLQALGITEPSTERGHGNG